MSSTDLKICLHPECDMTIYVLYSSNNTLNITYSWWTTSFFKTITFYCVKFCVIILSCTDLSYALINTRCLKFVLVTCVGKNHPNKPNLLKMFNVVRESKRQRVWSKAFEKQSKSTYWSRAWKLGERFYKKVPVNRGKGLLSVALIVSLFPVQLLFTMILLNLFIVMPLIHNFKFC